jgi:hypothetical protein
MNFKVLQNLISIAKLDPFTRPLQGPSPVLWGLFNSFHLSVQENLKPTKLTSFATDHRLSPVGRPPNLGLPRASGIQLLRG